MGDEIVNHVPPAQGQGPTTDSSTVEHAFHIAFAIIMSQIFDQFMRTTKAPQPQQPQLEVGEIRQAIPFLIWNEALYCFQEVSEPK
ncbi:hypothetical protein PVK06_043125 [Gossypium arboreum]|uniref:Uncharacterized protein n=1 Tax=Gossypium arboreum TaxID=29729 RepID=A0ABR0MN31_GOSAR|nr:hypothetical protein PVK06_043125 [Gossypium arboreum]